LDHHVDNALAITMLECETLNVASVPSKNLWHRHIQPKMKKKARKYHKIEGLNGGRQGQQNGGQLVEKL